MQAYFWSRLPHTGHLDYLTADDMKTDSMSRVLKHVSKAHHKKFIIMVLDMELAHKAKVLVIPSNVSLIILPPYSPELNPAERIWNTMRRDYFLNRYIDSLDEAVEQAECGLEEMKSNRSAFRSLTYWDWIKGILNQIRIRAAYDRTAKKLFFGFITLSSGNKYGQTALTGN
jgi:transposase